ncbi:MAG: peptidylprolyl isomerase [Rhizobiales bacterium]|nr:peptidylprolyl isomerase [Hyphomicrobiales bacterium]
MQARPRSSMWAATRDCIRNSMHGNARFAVVFAAAALIAGATSPTQAQQVIAVVNGVPITSYDVDQRMRLNQLSTNKSPSRNEVLEDLINDRVKLNEAKRFGIEASNADVENAFASMASRMGVKPEQLVQGLSGRGLNVETLKSRIRADLAWGNLVRGRYQATLQVGEGDIHAMLGPPSENQKDAVGHVYTLRPILFIVPQGSPPSAFEARRREADALRSRFNSCEQGVTFARELRDVAVRDTIIRSSANLPAPLRTMLNSLEIGKLTSPDTTAQGIELFALCGKEVTRAETPRKQEARQEIFAKRFDAQSKRYLERVRRSAMIEYK